MVVQRIEEMHRAERASYRDLCSREGVSHASFVRWKGRITRGEDLSSRPGPRKVEPLDLEALREEIRVLRHSRKRTMGSGALYRCHQKAISRRDLQGLIADERQRQKMERDRIYHRVRWKKPCLVWAMDDTPYHPDKAYPMAYLHNVQDLGSRYKFEPLVGLSLAKGDEVAANLHDLFETHWPPLFLKRDNGKNLNHHLVDELLEAFWVIPVNSPCYYPQYNGGIEAAQREIKDRLSRHQPPPHAFLSIEAGLNVHALNHKRRPCLRNRTSCEVLVAGQSEARRFTRRKRKEVYDTIKNEMLRLMEDQRLNADAAWRLAVETWLLDNGFISVFNKPKVLPH